MVEGMAGTGKTVAVCARVELHQVAGRLGQDSKVAYISESQIVANWVKRVLEWCGVDVENHVRFINSKPGTDGEPFHFQKTKVELIKQGFRFIYFDSAEDIGLTSLAALCEEVVETRKNRTKEAEAGFCGDVWILFDQYQCLVESDRHMLLHNSKKKGVFWRGERLDDGIISEGRKLGSIITLKTSFRMPDKVIEHVERNKLLPVESYPDSTHPDSGFVSISSATTKSLVKEVSKEIFQFVHERKIHPGHCAIVFEDQYSEMLFEDIEDDKGSKINNKEDAHTRFIKNVESELEGLKNEENQPTTNEAKMFIKGTTVPIESFQYSHLNVKTPETEGSASKVVSFQGSSVAKEKLLFQLDHHAEVRVQINMHYYVFRVLRSAIASSLLGLSAN